MILLFIDVERLKKSQIKPKKSLKQIEKFRNNALAKPLNDAIHVLQ